MIELGKSEKYMRLEALGMGPYVMKKIKVCPKCGNISGARTLFCRNCRSRLPSKTLFDFYKKMHSGCSNCGTRLASDARYCPHCGKEVPRGSNEINSDNQGRMQK